MRRLLCLLLLVFALPVAASGLLDTRPSATLGGASLNNSADFLPVGQAFQLEQVQSSAQDITLRFVIAEGYYLYRHRFEFKAEPADIALGTAQLPPGEAKRVLRRCRGVPRHSRCAHSSPQR